MVLPHKLEIINQYKGPENEVENTIEKNGTDKVISKDTKIYYIDDKREQKI